MPKQESDKQPNVLRRVVQKIMSILSPYADVLLFLVCLFVSNIIWKMSVNGDEAVGNVSLFGHDITTPFAAYAEHIASVCAWLLNLVSDTVHYYPPYVIRFDSGFAARIVWSCTPVKQGFIWLVIILCARGSWKRKTWFIPMGWVIIHFFNIIRIAIIALLCENHPDMFVLWHEYVFKYVFYGMLFMLWVWWVERLGQVKPFRRDSEKRS